MKKIQLATLASLLFFNTKFQAQTTCDTLFLKNGETRLVSIWEENFEGWVCEICPSDGRGDRFLFQKEKIERVGRGKMLPKPKPASKPTALPKPEKIAAKPAEPSPPKLLEINDYKIWVYPTAGQKPRSGYFFSTNDSVLTLQKRVVYARDLSFQVDKIEKIKIRNKRNLAKSISKGAGWGGLIGGFVGLTSIGLIYPGCGGDLCTYAYLFGSGAGFLVGAPLGATVGWLSATRRTTFTIEGKKDRYKKQFLEKIKF